MIDYVRAEKLYIDFIKFRKEFMTDAIARAVYTDTNRYNERFRPVVVISPDELTELNKKIAHWQKTADELEKYPELKIPQTLMLPLPKVVVGARRVYVYTMDAINVKNESAGAIINQIERKIKRSQSIPACAGLVEKLQREVEILSKYPADERMRVRRVGFSDTIAKVNYPDAPGEAAIERVTAHGLFVVSNPELEVHTEPTRTRDNFSVYDALQGLETAMWPDTKIYLVSEVEEAKAKLKDYREKNKKKLNYAASRRSIEKRRQRDAVASATAASHREQD